MTTDMGMERGGGGTGSSEKDKEEESTSKHHNAEYNLEMVCAHAYVCVCGRQTDQIDRTDR